MCMYAYPCVLMCVCVNAYIMYVCVFTRACMYCMCVLCGVCVCVCVLCVCVRVCVCVCVCLSPVVKASE